MIAKIFVDGAHPLALPTDGSWKLAAAKPDGDWTALRSAKEGGKRLKRAEMIYERLESA